MLQPSLSQSVLENSKNGLGPEGENSYREDMSLRLDLGGGHRRDSKSPPG